MIMMLLLMLLMIRMMMLMLLLIMLIIMMKLVRRIFFGFKIENITPPPVADHRDAGIFSTLEATNRQSSTPSRDSGTANNFALQHYCSILTKVAHSDESRSNMSTEEQATRLL